MKIYGSMLCPDCVECKKALDKAGIAYTYLDIGESLGNLKAFLTIRDSNPLFDAFRGTRTIGIPCIVLEDGSVTLDWESCM